MLADDWSNVKEFRLHFDWHMQNPYIGPILKPEVGLRCFAYHPFSRLLVQPSLFCN